ncbi:DUF2169 domain-containing protein [Bermanella marisrubri]|uniref:Pentapeptide repeat family protein n=1 Tax=Bermanella marisrubri TaxID=207949 RepID=Q1N519_9GAMM|nr:DUF2169 domain-containing protein [Bermanella marisrubri]EAT13259.1 pentapeptide repeat family protein [Oceanobacter sp. RED65] [Bermanella marisrubri]QIZ84026.1 DUF2169 domain-containing protein [Bermanella marisrubri]
MNVIQPLDLESGYRVFQFRGQNYLVITSKLYFPLLGGDPLLFSEAYQALADLPEPFIDEGLPKTHAEFFIYGNAQSLNSEPVAALDVTAKIADVTKTIRVIGDRYWTGGLTGTTSPTPFTEMPLVWQNAFGGKGNDANPDGKGTTPVKTDWGEELIAMPNLELPKQLLTSPKQNPTPAGFGSIMPNHPLRMRYMGTYDEKWIAEDFPGYPKDFDFRAFNHSMPDQHFTDFLEGGEPIELTGVHAEHSEIHSVIPRFNVKTHLVKTGLEWQDISESDLVHIDNRIDTIALFPNQLMGMMIYRGVIKIDTNDGSEFQYLLNAYEDNATNRTRKDYCNSLVGRIHPDLSMRYSLTTRDLIPDSIPCGMARLTNQETEPRIIMAEHIEEQLKETKEEKVSEVKLQLQEAIEQQKAQGLDTSMLEQQLQDIDVPKKDEWQIKFEKIADRLSPMDKETGKLDLLKLDFTAFDDLSKISEEYAQFQKDQAQKRLEDQIEEAIQQDQSEVANALSDALDRLHQPPQLPRPSDYQKTLEELTRIKQAGHGQDLDLVELETKLKAGHEAQIEGYRLGAHMMEHGTLPHKDDLNELQDWVNEQIEKGASLSHCDLAGLDFSDKDLRGIDLSHAYLEQCNFKNSDLTNSNLQGAIAVRCDFSHAKLIDCNLDQANIGGSMFAYCELRTNHSKEIEIAKSDFSNSVLGPIDFSNITNLLETRFEKCQLNSVNFSDATFLESSFAHSEFKSCQLSSATFQECNLQSISVFDSDFSGANFIECIISSSDWRKSDLTNTRILSNSTLSNSLFYDCILADATLRKIDLNHTRYNNCTMNRCDMSESNFQYGELCGSTVKDALFMNTDCNGANLSNTNLMASNFMQADLSNANLSRSNFYGCEFLSARVHHTDFSRSILDSTKLEDWRPNKWQ